MSLKEAVLEIADQMEADLEGAEGLEDTLLYFTIRDVKSCVRQLRSACKAAGNDAVAFAPSLLLGTPGEGAEIQNRSMIEAAKAEFRKNPQQMEMVDEALGGARMVPLLNVPGHEGEPDVFELSSEVPVGAKVPRSEERRV